MKPLVTLSRLGINNISIVPRLGIIDTIPNPTVYYIDRGYDTLTDCNGFYLISLGGTNYEYFHVLSEVF